MIYDHYEDGLRVLKMHNNYEYKIVLNRENALWYIETSSGSVPMKLSGAYTSASEAAKAVKNYQDIPKKVK